MILIFLIVCVAIMITDEVKNGRLNIKELLDKVEE